MGWYSIMENIQTDITPFRKKNAQNKGAVSVHSTREVGALNTKWCKTDENKILNENSITWVQKMGECLAVCTKSVGCSIGDTHKICKLHNFDSYNKLNKHFE